MSRRKRQQRKPTSTPEVVSESPARPGWKHLLWPGTLLPLMAMPVAGFFLQLASTNRQSHIDLRQALTVGMGLMLGAAAVIWAGRLAGGNRGVWAALTGGILHAVIVLFGATAAGWAARADGPISNVLGFGTITIGLYVAASILTRAADSPTGRVRIGFSAWLPALVVIPTGMVGITHCFRHEGLGTNAILAGFLLFWLTARTLQMGWHLRGYSQVGLTLGVADQLLRGRLLIAGFLLTSFLPGMAGIVAFVFTFFLFSTMNWLAKRLSHLDAEA